MSIDSQHSYPVLTTSTQADPAVSPGDPGFFHLQEAACAGDTDLEWIPDRREVTVVPLANRQTCAACPGRQDCLLWALANDEPGYWAGSTKRDRQRMRSLGQTSLTVADELQRRARAEAGHTAPNHPPGMGSRGRYNKGCHCGECCEANRLKARARRARRRADLVQHGVAAA